MKRANDTRLKRLLADTMLDNAALGHELIKV